MHCYYVAKDDFVILILMFIYLIDSTREVYKTLHSPHATNMVCWCRVLLGTGDMADSLKPEWHFQFRWWCKEWPPKLLVLLLLSLRFQQLGVSELLLRNSWHLPALPWQWVSASVSSWEGCCLPSSAYICLQVKTRAAAGKITFDVHSKGFARARALLEISLESAPKALDVSVITAGVIFPCEISFLSWPTQVCSWSCTLPTWV